MNPTWPLRLFLDCSTAHLCPETRDKLEAQASGGERLIGATPLQIDLQSSRKCSSNHQIKHQPCRQLSKNHSLNFAEK